MKYLYAYRNIALPANAVTALACYDLWRTPVPSALLYLVWFKLFILAALVGYIHFFRSSVVYFFMNLGLGRLEFYGSIICIDLAISIFCLTLVLLV